MDRPIEKEDSKDQPYAEIICNCIQKVFIALLPPLCIIGGALIGPLATKYPMSDQKAARGAQQISWRYGAEFIELILIAPVYIYY